ncbi:hypothetical protein [Pseudoduganella chitinolytica]|uniref:Uncharacterized protein n=1 Tax=Pseudoduganella chitinolytica TaxID=34070 RepID=A0ABY8BIP1_9BURK|nr:hypothetical protein [Pseudoduganella chitinolytica]WEF34134.1 hypothetical protein PX653_05015 [Pseudoduganella chitinolytica]
MIGRSIVYPLQIVAQHAGVPYGSVFLAYGSLPTAYAHPLGTFGPKAEPGAIANSAAV